MKNASSTELVSLQSRAQAIARSLPPLERTADGLLSPQSRQALSRRMQRILLQNRAVGASIVLCLPDAPAEYFHFGHARLKPKMPVTADTCFRIASVS